MASIASPAARAATAYARSVVLAPRARTLYAPRHIAQGSYPCPCHPGPSRLGGPSARYSDSAPSRGDAATGGLEDERSSTGASKSSGALERSALPSETQAAQEARDGQQVRTDALAPSPAPSPAPAPAPAPEERDPYSLTEDFLRGAAADTAERSAAADADNGATSASASASASGLSEREKAQKEDEMVQRDWLQAQAHGTSTSNEGASGSTESPSDGPAEQDSARVTAEPSAGAIAAAAVPPAYSTTTTPLYPLPQPISIIPKLSPDWRDAPRVKLASSPDGGTGTGSSTGTVTAGGRPRPRSPLTSDGQRLRRGVHDPRKRSEGMTQHESRNLGQLLRQALSRSGSRGAADIDAAFDADGMHDWSLGVGLGGSHAQRIWNPYGAHGQYDAASARRHRDRTSWPLSMSTRRADAARLLAKPESADDPTTSEALEALKEELSLLHTETDFVQWSRKRVFVTLPPSALALPSLPLPGDAHPSDPRSSTTGAGATFHPVYPHIFAYLLHRVRVEFDNPHLVLALFAHAQSLSVESYLAGCLAPAYNEVLRVRWEAFADLNGVLAGVKEMEANGVRWDKGTSTVVDEVVAAVGRDVFEHAMSDRWGKGVYDTLATLEQAVQRDLTEQERIAQVILVEKRRRREWKEGGGVSRSFSLNPTPRRMPERRSEQF